MHYTIYKITNKLNGKFYIGKHQTKDLNDGYMGSGKILKRAIEKHGMDNFQKEILFIFDNEQEMNDKEKELVTLHEMSYNLCPGGKGGFGYINGNGLTHCSSIADMTEYSKLGNTRKTELLKNDEEFRKKYSESISKSKLGEKNPRGFKNKKHSSETKKQMSESAKGRIPWNKGLSWKEWYPKDKK